MYFSRSSVRCLRGRDYFFFINRKTRQQVKLPYWLRRGNGKLVESYTHILPKPGHYLVCGIWSLLIVKISLSIYLSDNTHKAWIENLLIKGWMVPAVMVTPLSPQSPPWGQFWLQAPRGSRGWLGLPSVLATNSVNKAPKVDLLYFLFFSILKGSITGWRKLMVPLRSLKRQASNCWIKIVAWAAWPCGWPYSI